MIEHPIGPKAGFKSVYEVQRSLIEAFNFQQDQFGEMGLRVFRGFQHWVKPLPLRKKQVVEIEVDTNYASQKKAELNLEKVGLDPTNSMGLWDKVMNTVAKKSYKQRSDHFKRMVSEEHSLLALYSALDDFQE